MKVTLTSTAMKSDTISLKVVAKEREDEMLQRATGPLRILAAVERTLYKDTVLFGLNLFQGNLMFSFKEVQVYVWKIKNW